MTQVTSEELTARYGAAYKWYVALTTLVGVVAMNASSTIVNVAMPSIMGEFGLGQDQAQWLSTAFLASMTPAMLTANWAFKAFGSRGAFSIALGGFALGSIIGAYSPNENWLIVARVIQGAAAGLTITLGTVNLFQAFPPNRRGTAMGMYSMGVILAPAIGPTVGGMLIDNYSWHYVFYLGLPFCAISYVMATMFLSTEREKERPPFDWLGFILLSVAIAAFLTGMSNRQRLGMDSAFVRWSFCLSIIATIAFVAQELRTKTPLLALEVYTNPRFVAASVVGFVYGAGIFGSTYLIPLFVQTVQGYTPTESGLLLMPAGFVLALISPPSGRISDFMPPHIPIFVGTALFAISGYLMSHVSTDTAFWTFAGYIVLGRFGMGITGPSLNIGSLKVLDPSMLSHAAGSMNFARQMGGALGVNLLSVYLEQQTTFYAHEINTMQTGSHAGATTLRLLAGALHRAGLDGSVATGEAHRFLSSMVSAQASVMGFRESFLLMSGICFVGVFLALFMRSKQPQ